MPLCGAQLLEEEEEEISGRDPLCQMGLQFQGEQVARDGGDPRRRTTFEAAREGAEEGSGHGLHSWPQGAGGLSVPLSAKRSTARSETSSSAVAMSCKSPEQAQLYLPLCSA